MLKRTTRLFVALLAFGPLSVQASLIGIDFSLTSPAGGLITGNGTAFTNDTNLTPGSSTMNPADLVAMSISLAGIPSIPAMTSFTKADLNDIEWFLSVDGAGTINDLNFFMRNGAANSDGYSIEGFGNFAIALCGGTAQAGSCTAGTPLLGSLQISVTGVRSVPIPATLVLMALGLVGIGFQRHKQVKVA